MWGVRDGGGWYTPRHMFQSVSKSVQSASKYKLLSKCDFYSRQNIFDLITRDNHPTNFSCINVSSIDL